MKRELFRIRTVAALGDTGVYYLFDKAFASELPSDGDSVIGELMNIVEEDFVIIGVAKEGGILVGLTIAFLPTDDLFKVPTVYHFYSVGSSGMRNMMIDAVVDWVKENGYNKFLASNFTKRPDCLWKRLFRRAGKLEKVGSIYMFELKEE